MPTNVKEIRNLSDIPQAGKAIIDFYATWCGPCKRLAPIFEELSDHYPEITFLKVDVDEAEEIAEKFAIESLPTFILFHEGSPIRRLQVRVPNEFFEALEALKKM